MNKYVLVDKMPVRCNDVLEWAEQFELANRQVAQDDIGDAHVSTVFLGIDHNFGGGRRPILFETMIFGGPHDQFQDRYSTWDQAEAGHKRVVEALKSGRDPSL